LLKPPEVRPIATEKPIRRNEEIRAWKVRVIDAEGKQIGILSRNEALDLAREQGLDLVEIQPNAEPPVCRIMDFGKFRFEQQKKAQAAKKKQKQIEVKELKFRPTTDEGDYQRKLRDLRSFLGEGDKVKVTVRFRGREVMHSELGLAMTERIEKDLGDEAIIEQRPRLEGRQMVMLIAPRKR
jgi:translation initiation factor IF-3